MGSKPTVLAEPILVGRGEELAKLSEFLDNALQGQGRTVFLSGEAGSGKTRLTSEFIRTARKKGITVLTGWCLSNAAVPYFPFIEAFDSFLAESEGEISPGNQQMTIKKWLIESNQSSQEGLSPQAWKDKKFAGITKEILLLSTERPLILFIDDLHWADSASLALLHYISRAIGSEKILILATFRSEEVALSPGGFTHPLLDTLRLMNREDLYKEIKVLNLGSEGVRCIAQNMLNGNVNQELVEKLSAEGRGNPLFVIETVRLLFESASLVLKDGEWTLTADKLMIPSKIKDIILRRLSALKPHQRRILDIASVIGDKIEPDVLGAVLNKDILMILESLSSVALSRSLISVEGDYYRFDHAISREVLYEEIQPPLKKAYHQRVAEKIEALNLESKHPPFTDLAYHYTMAGNRKKSIEYNLAAANDALARFSNAEAIKGFSYLIEAIEQDSEYFDKKVIAMEGLGDAFFASGTFDQAIKTYETIADVAVNDSVKLRALRKAVVSCYWRGDSKHALELASKAKDYENVDEIEYSRLRLYKGFILGRSNLKITEAIEDMSASLKIFEKEFTLPDIARALVEISFAYPMAGRLEEALSSAIRSVALYKELGDERQYAFALGRLGSALGMCRYTREALDVYNKANKIDEKIGDFNIMAFHFMMSGVFLESLGDIKASIDKNIEGLHAAEKTDATYVKSLCLANLVRGYTKLGQINEAENIQGKLEKLLKDNGALKTNINTVIQAELSRAFLLAHKGKVQEAYEVFKKNISASQLDWKIAYAWILEKQGLKEEANAKVKQAKDIIDKIDKRFEHSNIQTYILANTKPDTDEKVEVRLDILNIGRAPLKLIRIENLIPERAKILSLPRFGKLDNESLIFEEKVLDSIGITSLKYAFTYPNTGNYILQPKVIYIDDQEVTRSVSLNPIMSAPKLANAESQHDLPGNVEVKFESDAAQKILDYLIAAFHLDTRQRMPQERSGWRTLMEIIRETKVSKFSVYGSSVGRGYAICELKKSGLIEDRVFAGERGRGGNIIKIRASYEKNEVRDYEEKKKIM